MANGTNGKNEKPTVQPNSKAWLCNIALLNIKNSPTIIDLDKDRSVAAQTCRYYYDIALEDALTDFMWKFAMKESELTDEKAIPIVGNEFAYDGWRYTYKKPDKYLQGNSIFSGRVTDNYWTRVPYDVFLYDEGTNEVERIFTKNKYQKIKHTKSITDIDKFPASFIIAFSFKISMFIAPRLTLGDDRKLNDELERKYLYSVNQAKLKNSVIGVNDKPPQSEYDKARWS